MKKRKEKSAAVLTLHDVSRMTTAGRRSIIRWLNNQIKNIQKYHHVNGKPGFAKRFTARYLYTSGK